MEIRVSDRWVDGLLGIFGFCLVFNFVFSLQRDKWGLAWVPVWLLLLMICLVARTMRDQKILALILLMGIAYFNEWTRQPPKAGDMFELFKYIFFTTIAYFPPLLFFCTGLFARIDSIRLDHSKARNELDLLGQEAGRVEIQASELSRRMAQNESGEPRTLHDLYTRAMTDLVHMRTAKDLPGILFRNLCSGYNMDRGLIVELSEGRARVLEGWGIPGGRAPDSIRIPIEVVQIVKEKGGAVLERELDGPGMPHEDLEALAADAFSPVALLPVMVGGQARYLVVAGGSEEMGRGLKVIPSVTLADLAGRFVDRHFEG